MTDTKKLLQLRAHLKKKRPLFSRKDNNKKGRIEDDVWRKARGCDNKQRLKRKGHKKTPRMGFRGPALVRGLHKSGLEQVLVSNVEQLKKLNNKTQGVLVSASTGNRKRVQILEEAKKHGLSVLNKDADKKAEQIHTQLKLRKEMKNKKAAEVKKEETAHKKDKENKEEKSHHNAEHDTHHDKKDEHKTHEHDAEAQRKAEEAEKNKVLHNKQ